MLVGIYEIVESVFKIQTAMDARHYQLSGWGLLLFSAIVYLLFGIFPDLQPCKGRQPVRSGHGHFADLRRN
ncbi:MAG: hypothetical protein ACLURV_12870 [Gallintestinimicrobium sp.]